MIKSRSDEKQQIGFKIQKLKYQYQFSAIRKSFRWETKGWGGNVVFELGFLCFFIAILLLCAHVFYNETFFGIIHTYARETELTSLY